ncbi:NnrU family protein [Desulforhopalus sp. 52FAK]
MHSLLIDPTVAGYCKERLGVRSTYYRLLYNLLSILTLVPLLVVGLYDKGPVVFSWSGWIIGVRFVLFAIALCCFLAGAKGYNMQYFLGFQQIRDGKEQLLLGDSQSFSESGIFGVIRHPWYLGTLLFVWSMYGVYYQKNFAVAVILTIYLVVGTLLEERKILSVYGDRYRDYQNRVSMFVPIKWLKNRRKLD